MSFLFSPAALGQISLKNRIIVPPMCQYSAIDGMPTAWHHSHYMNLALSGASLVIVEASAVTPLGVSPIKISVSGMMNRQPP